MKETPLLMCAEMVRVTLEGRKTQTRRVVNPQPTRIGDLNSPRRQKRGDLFLAPDIFPTGEIVGGKISTSLVFAYAEGVGTTRCMGMVEFCRDHCPYGQPGDKLWVRETFAEHPEIPHTAIYRSDRGGDYQGAAQGDFKWNPSIYMPRWASRLTLEIVSVRVERIQDIHDDDAEAEGVLVAFDDHPEPPNAGAQFRRLWDSINAKRGFSWASNPWVWVIEFKKL